jgi:hypothetical protein
MGHLPDGFREEPVVISNKRREIRVLTHKNIHGGNGNGGGDGLGAVGRM